MSESPCDADNAGCDTVMAARQRSGLLPDAPAMIEAGVAGYEASTAFGVLAPAATPREIVMRLNVEIVRLLQLADVKERLAAQGVETVGSTPRGYAEHLRDELARYGRLVKAAGITVE